MKAVREIEPEPATTREVADRLGYTISGTVRRLKRLEERGVVKHKQSGSGYIWFRSIDENPLTEIYQNSAES